MPRRCHRHPAQQRTAVGNLETLDGVADLLGDRDDPAGGGVREQDDELFSTVARGEVAGASDRRANRTGAAPQALVAGRMAVRVVIGFEEVDVDHEQADGAPVAQSDRPIARERVVEGAPVR